MRAGSCRTPPALGLGARRGNGWTLGTVPGVAFGVNSGDIIINSIPVARGIGRACQSDARTLEPTLTQPQRPQRTQRG